MSLTNEQIEAVLSLWKAGSNTWVISQKTGVDERYVISIVSKKQEVLIEEAAKLSKYLIETESKVPFEIRKEAMKPQEPWHWRGLSDVQWMNIVNHDSCYLNQDKEDAIHLAVKLTEARLKGNNTTPQPIQNPQEPVGYQELFDAIAAATSVACFPGINISIEAFTAKIGPLFTTPQPCPIPAPFHPTDIQILEAAEKAGLWPNTIHTWMSAFHRFFDALNEEVRK